MYGFSAGGHTALSLAGGRWSPALFTKHCEAHIAEDFQSCVGLATRLRGDFLDGPRKWLALKVIEHRFTDAAWEMHTDPRIAAIVAACPYAADFDITSFDFAAHSHSAEQPNMCAIISSLLVCQWLSRVCGQWNLTQLRIS